MHTDERRNHWGASVWDVAPYLFRYRDELASFAVGIGELVLDRSHSERAGRVWLIFAVEAAIQNAVVKLLARRIMWGDCSIKFGDRFHNLLLFAVIKSGLR